MVSYEQQIQERAEAVAAAQADIDIGEKELAKRQREIERFRVSPKFSRKERREFTRLQLRRAVGERRAAKRAAFRTFAQEQARFQAEAAPVRAQMEEIGTQIRQIQEYKYGADLFWRQADVPAGGFAPFDPRMSEAAKKGFIRAATKKKFYDFPTVPIGDIDVRMPRTEYYKLKDKLLTAELSGQIIKRFAPTKYPQYVSQRIGALSQGRVSISPGAISKFQRSGIGLTWAGKRFSPLPLELALGSEVARASRASTIVPTTEAMPKMMSSEASSRQRIIKALEFKQSLFTVGKTRNPKTWTNLDPVTKLRERIRERAKGYTAKGLTIKPLPGIPKVLSGIEKLRERVLRKTSRGVLASQLGRKITYEFGKLQASVKEEIYGTEKSRIEKGGELSVGWDRLPSRPPMRETIMTLPTLDYSGLQLQPEIKETIVRKVDYTLRPEIRKLSPEAFEETITSKYPVAGQIVLGEIEQKRSEEKMELKGETVGKELESSKFATDLQESVEKGLLSGEEAQELYQKEFQKKMKPFIEKEQKGFEEKILGIQERARWKVYKQDIPVIATIGIPLGIATALIPGAPLVVGGAFALSFATLPVEQYRQMAKYPGLTAAYMGTWMVAGGIGGAGVKAMKMPQIRPFTPIIYKGIKAPPKFEFIGFKKGKIVTITKTYPAWKGTLESPFMRGLRKIPIIKKIKPAKIVTISGKVQYKALVKLKPIGKGKATGTVEMWRVPKRGAPKSVTYATIKGTQLIRKGLKGEPKFIKALGQKLTRKGVETQLLGGRVKTQLEFKLGKPLKKAIADVEVTKIVRVTDIGKGKFKYTLFEPGRRTVRGTIIGKSAKMTGKSVFEELGIKKWGESFPRIRKIDYMRGITFKGKPKIVYDIVGKYKPPKGKLIGKDMIAVQARKLKTIPLWQRGFPKFMEKVMPKGKKAQLPFSRTDPIWFQRRFQPQLQLEPKPTSPPPPPSPKPIYSPPRSVPPSFKTLTPIAGGAALLFPRYAPSIPSRFISPTTTAFFPIIKTEVLPTTIIKLGLKPVIKPISLTGIKPIVITGQAPRQAQAQALAISQLQVPILRTGLIQRPILRQVQKPVQIQIQRPRVTTTPFILFPTPSRVRRISKKRQVYVPAYRVFVKRKGERVFLSGMFPRGEAVKIGAREARQTLRATFGVVEAGRLRRRARPPEFIPSPEIFRTYQIIRGQRVPLKDTWIQKAPYRLSARGEVREIQVARKRRKGGRKVKWF